VMPSCARPVRCPGVRGSRSYPPRVPTPAVALGLCDDAKTQYLQTGPSNHGQDDQIASVEIWASRARCRVPRDAALGALIGPARAWCAGCQMSLRGLSSGQCSLGGVIVVKAQGGMTVEASVCRSLTCSCDVRSRRC
jgi:hypothetical protein